MECPWIDEAYWPGPADSKLDLIYSAGTVVVRSDNHEPIGVLREDVYDPFAPVQVLIGGPINTWTGGPLVKTFSLDEIAAAVTLAPKDT
ncbi:MAG TPA: hypothetical protein VIY48_18990 [Candidatus Paceibacterota bacterium]